MLISISFDLHSSPFDVIEQLSRRAPEVTGALERPEVSDGVVVLSTCNRFEAYLEVPSLGARPLDAPGAVDLVADAAGIPRGVAAAAAEIRQDRRAAEHLFAVASGLESAVVGEGEIAGQVRRAHDAARDRGSLTHELERLFQSATRTSREVGHRTGLRSAGRSLVRLSLRLAESRIPDWSQARVLLIGTGAYAGATVSALRGRGARLISVHSPSGRAEAYAESHALEPVGQGGLRAALSGSDLVVACSRAEEPLLTAPDLATETRHRRLLIDLGMPRNIDPAVDGLPGIDLLDLETVARHAGIAELGPEAEALEIVRRAAEEFAAEQAERDAVPALLSLRDHVLGILEEEICRAHRGSGREGEVNEEVAAAMRRLTGKLLHTPMTRIRTLGREGRASEAGAAIEALFGLDPAPREDSPAATGELGPVVDGERMPAVINDLDRGLKDSLEHL